MCGPFNMWLWGEGAHSWLSVTEEAINMLLRLFVLPVLCAFWMHRILEYSLVWFCCAAVVP